MSTSALAAPPMKRRTRNGAKVGANPMAPVVSALATSAPSNQTRRGPGKFGEAASRAPARYPRKFADAMRPAADLVRPNASIIGGRIGV